MKHIKTNVYDYYIDEKGNIQGEYKHYYPNGQLWVRTYFKDGKRHGDFKSYLSDGQLEYHSYFEDGIEKGLSYLKQKKIEEILK